MISDSRLRCTAKIALDLILLALGYLLAWSLRFDGTIPDVYLHLLGQTLLPIVAINLASVFLLTRYRQTWRYVSLHDLSRLSLAVLLSTLLIWLSFPRLFSPSLPRGVLVNDALLDLFALVGIRVVARLLFAQRDRRLRRLGIETPSPLRRVLIVRAGSLGEQAARSIRQASETWDLVGFVDDLPEMKGIRIHGKPVLGPLSRLPELLDAHAIDDVLIALPGLAGRRMSEIIRLCENSSARLSLIPELHQLVNGTTPLQSMREVHVEDLLEREPITLNASEIHSFLKGQRVLVTGAGGSIGSEICRQVLKMEPEIVVMLGRGENSIFEAYNDMAPGSKVKPVIASITDTVRLRTVFEQYRPSVVFHAAAHKHVPLMEAHPSEAIQNNVFGTLNLVELCDEYRVRKFVLISTDKAVNPTSVMGASKRLAEMILQIEAKTSATEFVSVRFGNVLGSRGSVVPTMQRQIQAGGPVRVTHEEMCRYFMTIPEAVQLVLQAGAMGRTDEVFVLDMGKPVKIIDLARNLIRLSGRIPDKEIKIEIVGMRPGEKLYEELLTAEEGVTATCNSRLYVAKRGAGRITREGLSRILDDLEVAVTTRNDAMIKEILIEAIPSYQPQGSGRPLRTPAAYPEKEVAQPS